MSLISELLTKSGDDIEKWWNDISSHLIEKPDLNWHVFAFSAGNRAFQNNPPETKWVKVAVSIYEDLAKRGSASESFSLELSAMNLRARFIKKLNQVPADPLLNIDQIENWIISRLELTLEQATQKSKTWQSLNVSEIAKLRQIKNMLNVLALLPEFFLKNQKLTDWLAIHKELP